MSPQAIDPHAEIPAAAVSPTSVLDHYERLLGPIYVWMLGGLDSAVARQAEQLARLGVFDAAATSSERRALDVGCGPGPQSLALAEHGYAVTALDPSAVLLDLLDAERKRRELRIDVIRDGVPLGDRHPGPFDVITCMVDTLLSLPDRDTAHGFVHDAARRLSPAGKLVLSFRDLTRLPEGDQRFLPVRSDQNRVLCCFLEAIDDDHVRVHDVLFERQGEAFTQSVSSYVKLRLSPGVVVGWLEETNLIVERREQERGMHLLVAAAPS